MSESHYVNVKCNAYFHKYEMYIDPGYVTRLKTCFSLMSDIRAFTPRIFYRPMEILELTGNHIDAMTALTADADSYVEVIPLLTFFMGPDGKTSNLMNGTLDIASPVALAVAERESLGLSYSEEFFVNLTRADEIKNAYMKFLVVNGWHLINVQFSIQMPVNFSDIFDGIVIYVEKDRAHLISRAEVLNFAVHFGVPIYLDMTGSTNKSGLLRPMIVLSRWSLLYPLAILILMRRFSGLWNWEVIN